MLCRLIGHQPVRTEHPLGPMYAFTWTEDCSRCGEPLDSQWAPWFGVYLRGSGNTPRASLLRTAEANRLARIRAFDAWRMGDS